jgi:integrase
MSVKVRKYVKNVDHRPDCAKLRTCGCPRVHDGWEYYVKVRFASGQVVTEKRRVPLDNCTRAKAERYAQEREAELYRAGPAAKEAKKIIPTLREFAPRYLEEYCRANRQKPGTIIQKQNNLRTHLYPRFGEKRLDQVNDPEIQKLKAALADRNPKTVNNVLSTLSTLLKSAVEWNVIDRPPCTIHHLRVTQSPAPFYEPHEYEQLVRAARALDPRIELMVLLAGDAGLRLGEVIALEQTDLDFARSIIHVRRSEWEGYVTLPKSGRVRQVDLPARLKAALKANRHLRSERVLTRMDGPGGVTQVLLAKWMKRALRRAGMKVTNGGLHILRHTYCSRLAMLGVPALAIKELAGHQSLTTTMRYMHLSPSARSEAVRRLDEDVARFGDRMATARGSSDSPGPSGT